MSTLAFFEWMQGTPLSAYFLETTWSSPIIQCIHLIALSAFAGAILIVDVRLLGRGLTNTPVAQLTREAEKWLLGAFAVLLSSGIPQVFATALKEYYSPYFWLKMQLILAGLVFTFTIRRKVALADEERMGKVWPKLVALVSIAIWTSAAIWARLIGLLS